MSTAPNQTPLRGKSWTAYVAAILVAGFLGCVACAFDGSKYWQVELGLGVFAALYLLHKVLSLRSYHFYLDDIGVWVRSGYLPWSKGTYGIKWRDLDGATFRPSFLSWLFSSYTVIVQQRFTKSSQICLTQMHRGRATAGQINGLHESYLRKGS